MSIFIKNVSKGDAHRLIRWWNAHTKYYHFKQKNGKLYDVIRQDEEIAKKMK